MLIFWIVINQLEFIEHSNKQINPIFIRAIHGQTKSDEKKESHRGSAIKGDSGENLSLDPSR